MSKSVLVVIIFISEIYLILCTFDLIVQKKLFKSRVCLQILLHQHYLVSDFTFDCFASRYFGQLEHLVFELSLKLGNHGDWNCDCSD